MRYAFFRRAKLVLPKNEASEKAVTHKQKEQREGS